MADYWDKVVYAAESLGASNTLGARFWEQSGIPDIVEEIARIDDDGLTLSNALRLAVQSATQPLQALAYGAIEANRASTAALLSGAGAIKEQGAVSGLGLALGLPGFTAPAGSKAATPWHNYQKAWTPPGKTIKQEDGTYEQAQGVYHAATGGTLIAGTVDQMVATGDKPRWLELLVGKDWEGGPPYQMTQFLLGPGDYANGSFLPPSWDMYSPTAGTQVNNSDLRYASLLGDLMTEIALDPLNWAMKPIAAAIKGRTLLHPGQAVKGVSTVGASELHAEDLISAAKNGTIARRVAQTPPGIGMWDQRRLAKELTSGPRQVEANIALAKNKDFGKALEYYSNPRLDLDPSAAAEMAKASVYLDMPEEIAHLHMMAATRNATSTLKVREALTISSPDLANSLDSMLGIGDNVIEQALVDFPTGTQLPRGHVLSLNAGKFLDNALMEHPEARKIWDAMAAEEKVERFGRFTTAVEDWQKVAEPRWTLGDLMTAGRADQIMPRTLTGGANSRALVKAGLKDPSLFDPPTFSQALHGYTSKVHILPGGAHRFKMRHLLMSKPGLIFNLDDAESGQKVNDYIDYAGSIIGNGRGVGRWGAEGDEVFRTRTISNRLAKDYKFAEDPEVIRMKNAFFDAATVTSSPSMLRASIMDELQTYALAKIAEGRGFDIDVAQYVAKMGMDRGRNINAALNSADDGFSTVVMEDGFPLVLQNHPTTVQQAHVFVPLMDLAGVRKALTSAPMRGYTNPDSLISVAQIDNLSSLGVRNQVTGTQNLKAFGRVQTPIGGTYHAMVDWLDLVNNTFKMTVLLRLGYPVRNLGEGYLATVGSGVGLIKTLKHTEAVLPNLGYNWGVIGQRAFRRRADKVLTANGHRASEVAIAATLDKSNAALQISTDHLVDMIDVVADPITIDSLLRIAASPNSSAAEMERAKKVLDHLTEMKHRLGTYIESSATDGRYAETIDLDRKLYHADMGGGMGVLKDSIGRPIELEAGINSLPVGVRLDRPLSMTWSSPHAQAQLDGLFTPFTMSSRAVGAKNPRPGWAKTRIRGKEEGERQWREAMDKFEEMMPTHHMEYRENPNAMWKPFRSPKPGGKYRKYNHGSSQKWEFRARLKGADASPPKVVGTEVFGKEIDLRAAKFTQGMRVGAPDAKQVILSRFSDIDEATVDAAIGIDPNNYSYDLQWATDYRNEHPDVLFHGTDSELKPGDRILPSNEIGKAQWGYKTFKDDPQYAYATQDPNYAQGYAESASAGQPGHGNVYVVRPTRDVDAVHMVFELTDREREAMGLRGIGGGDSTTWSVWPDDFYIERGTDGLPNFIFGSKLSKSGALRTAREYKAAISKNSELFHEDITAMDGLIARLEAFDDSAVTTGGGAVRRTGLPVDRLESYGDEVIAAEYEVIGLVPRQHIMYEFGDRAAQEKLSNQLAKHGIYRTVFDDAQEWGGVNVMVHPKGMGTDGLKSAVRSEVDDMIRARVAAAGPIEAAPVPKGRPGQLKAWNKGMGHGLLQQRVEHIDPNFPFKLDDVLEKGGFEAIMDEAITQHVSLKRQNLGFRTALQQRQQYTDKLAKRSGTPYAMAAYDSFYGKSYLTDDALNGINGHRFRQLTSGDATVQSTIGFTIHRGDQIDNLRASWLKPRDILPTDPYYFDGFSNLMGRFYSDQVGATDARNVMRMSDPSAAINLDHIDPVMLRALGAGDRERLYNETIEWAMTTTEGRDWVRTIGLQPHGADFADDATLAMRAKYVRRRNVSLPRDFEGKATRDATRQLTGQQHVPYRQKGYDHRHEVDVENIIADHFNFADNFLLDNPRVAELFLTGQMSPDSLRALYDEQPWQLKPFNGAMAPTTAESKAVLRDMRSKRTAIAGLTDELDRMFSGALQKIGSNPETRMLRHPVFLAIADDDLQQRIAAAEQMMGRQISATELYDLSERSRVFAVKKMKETLYTLESRSSMDDYLRFVSPFFPAWYNAASRWGRFYRRNPGGVGKIASRWTTVSNSGMIVDENGNEITGAEAGAGAFSSYLLLPVGIGSFGPVQKLFPGAETAMNKTRIPMRSFDWIFQGEPGNPGFGPIIGMPLSFILEPADKLFQNDVGRFLINKILPVGTENTGNTAMDMAYPFLPTGIKRFLDEIFDTNKQINQFSTAVKVLGTDRIKGEYTKPVDNPVPGGPTTRVPTDQELLDDANRLSSFMSMTKVASAFLSPVAQQQQGHQDFIAGQWREIQDAAYAAGKGEYADEIFLSQYPRDYLLTLSTSQKQTGAQQTAYATANQRNYADLQRLAIAEMEDPQLLWAIDNYRETENGQGAIDQYSSVDFNPFSRARQFHTSPEGTNEPYIQMKDPAAMLEEGQIRYGWLAYNQARADVSARLVASGLPENSYQFLKERTDWMRETSKVLGKQYPDWYARYTNGEINTGKFAKRAEFYRAVTSNAEWMKGKEDHELPKLWEAYLEARDAAIEQMEATGKAKTTAAKANEEIKIALELKADMLGKDSPSFRLWYDRYFRNDVVNVDEGE